MQLKLVADKYKELNRQHKETQSVLEAVRGQLSDSQRPTSTAASDEDERLFRAQEEKREVEQQVGQHHLSLS